MTTILSGNQAALQAIKAQIANDLQNFTNYDSKIKLVSQSILAAKAPVYALRHSLILAHHITGYRADLNLTLFNLRASYNAFDDALKARLKTHERDIKERMEYLSDLRSDLELVQRLSYSNRISV